MFICSFSGMFGSPSIYLIIFKSSSFNLDFLQFQRTHALPFFQVTELPFFASKVRLGRTGAEEIYPLGPLNEYERSVVVIGLQVFNLIPCSFDVISFKKIPIHYQQGWLGEGKERVGNKHSEGGFLYQKMNRFLDVFHVLWIITCLLKIMIPQNK